MCVDVFNLGLRKNAKLRAQSFGSTAILDATWLVKLKDSLQSKQTAHRMEAQPRGSGVATFSPKIGGLNCHQELRSYEHLPWYSS